MLVLIQIIIFIGIIHIMKVLSGLIFRFEEAKEEKKVASLEGRISICLYIVARRQLESATS